MKSALIVFVVLIQICFGAKLPSDYKRCPKTNHKACLLAACQEVMRKLNNPSPGIGLPSIDPLDIPSMTIGAGTGAVIFEQKYTDLKCYGFSTMKVLRAEFDFEKKVLHFADLIKNLTIHSNYEVDGKLLVLPVKGSGVSTVVMGDLKVAIDLPFTEYKKRGNTYLKFDGVSLTLNPKHVSYYFDNLFNGDKILGDNINKVLNENWKEVFDDVKSGYETAYGLIVEMLCNQVFSRVPLSNVFVD